MAEVLDPTFERTLHQAFALWINPEIERRKAAGLISETFSLGTAQVLFGDEGPPIVRLNEEVRGKLLVKAARDVKQGDLLRAEEIAEFVGMELLDDDRDYGHFTIIYRDGAWYLLFNFLRNRKYAIDLISKAEQFADAAEHCWSKDLKGPFADNLFSACELLAMARLITSVLDKRTKSHGHIAANINSWRKLGNVGDDFVDLFNKFSKIRPKARYSPGPISKLPNGEAALKIVRDEIEHLRRRYSPKLGGRDGRHQ
jgi:hypothetical protein